MKTKIALLLAAALALAMVGVALAKGTPAHPAKPASTGKPSAGFQGELKALGITCPQAGVLLRGTFGGAGGGFLALTVSHATGKASSLVGKQVSLRLLRSTRITKNGPTVASKLKAGDRLSVDALMCSQGLVARTITATGKKS